VPSEAEDDDVSYPDDLRYTAEHEWARIDGDVVTVGITSYATDQLGDVVFVELPDVGRKLEAMKPFGVVEAVKTVSDLYAPVGGEVVEVNGALADNPAVVNQSPYEDGWMVRIRVADRSVLQQLMNSADYARMIEEQQA
jgi:glycine cleavage system H protein